MLFVNYVWEGEKEKQILEKMNFKIFSPIFFFVQPAVVVFFCSYWLKPLISCRLAEIGGLFGRDHAACHLKRRSIRYRVAVYSLIGMVLRGKLSAYASLPGLNLTK